jgi:hypothetical protein
MSTMITFAANNEFFRKRKRTWAICQCVQKNSPANPSQASTARVNRVRSAEYVGMSLPPRLRANRPTLEALQPYLRR